MRMSYSRTQPSTEPLTMVLPEKTSDVIESRASVSVWIGDRFCDLERAVVSGQYETGPSTRAQSDALEVPEADGRVVRAWKPSERKRAGTRGVRPSALAIGSEGPAARERRTRRKDRRVVVEGDRVDLARVGAVAVDDGARRHVPKEDGPVAAARGEAGVIGRADEETTGKER